ncbi:polysaccharide deacetylase family protein [Roseibium sp. MMSF_3544]|uniref:polysaccharide deacetylase family protein n=1 Tax=unclassified Roseibium TaxID=2629323 RepID=UPI00273D0C69|nr:polysaccharide deacetylase family protein [Roseibium sp. MMSF_3544]
MQSECNHKDEDLPVTRLHVSAKDRLRRQVKTLGLQTLSRTGLAGLVGRRYRGRGVILMFHEFTTEPETKLGQGCRIQDFEAIIKQLKASGREFVGMSEAMRRLTDPGGKPFAVLTFDDGYRSNMELALPVMERYQAPAVIYVPTEVVTRTINAWWLGLRDAVLKNDQVEFEPLGTRFACENYSEKLATFRHLLAWVWQDFRRADQLEPVFRQSGTSIPDLVDTFFMNEAEMCSADRHPLIEIGAHTTTHRALALLPDDEVRRDVGDNKIFLEQKLEREVPHFAFPYGRPSLTGRREAEIVRSLGFQTAVTTDPGCLFPDHLQDVFLLPRQDAEYPEDGLSHVICGMNGFYRALSTRGGPPVTDLAAEL